MAKTLTTLRTWLRKRAQRSRLTSRIREEWRCSCYTGLFYLAVDTRSLTSLQLAEHVVGQCRINLRSAQWRCRLEKVFDRAVSEDARQSYADRVKMLEAAKSLFQVIYFCDGAQKILKELQEATYAN